MPLPREIIMELGMRREKKKIVSILFTDIVQVEIK